MEQAVAALDVHEKHDDEQSFGDRNRKRDDEIEGTKINVTDSPREREQKEKCCEGLPINFGLMRGHLLVGRDGPVAPTNFCDVKM